MLTTSEDTIRAASAALLDKVRVPQAVGPGATAANLQNLRNRAVGWLDDWEQGTRRYPITDEGLDLKEVLLNLLASPLDTAAECPRGATSQPGKR